MISYMDRTRTYYGALGYPPYRWAHHDDVPFCALGVPLSESKVVLVTTAALVREGYGDQGPGALYNARAKFYDIYTAPTLRPPKLGISHIAYDRDHTTAEDQNSFFPLERMNEAVAERVIGGVAELFIGLPTNRSQRVTIEKDAPAAFAAARQCSADVAVFVPNCPVCHQSVSLVARHFESGGMPTVIMGCARDIVEHCGVARFLFSDFPLGNSAGKPFDDDSQRDTLKRALTLLKEANAPRTTWVSAQNWSVDDSWKEDYANVEKLSVEELRERREEFAKQKDVAKELRA